MTNENLKLQERLRKMSGMATDWFEVLPEESLSDATRTSQEFDNPSSSSIFLWVKTANEANAASFTPALHVIGPDDVAVVLWTAAAAITANGTYLYVLSPDTATGMNGGGITETALVKPPFKWKVILTYAGTPGTDKMDTQAYVSYV